MFRRWVIVLVFASLIPASFMLWQNHLWTQAGEDLTRIGNECSSLIEAIATDIDSNPAYRKKCSFDNLVSEQSLALRRIDAHADATSYGLFTTAGVIVVLLLSFLGRWVRNGS